MSKLNELRMIDDLRLLSLDMINNAKSGHPGICLSAAPMIYTLFANHMVYDLERPNWCNRDRFVLSAGHGSALLYATIYDTTEDFTLDDGADGSRADGSRRHPYGLLPDPGRQVRRRAQDCHPQPRIQQRQHALVWLGQRAHMVGLLCHRLYHERQPAPGCRPL